MKSHISIRPGEEIEFIIRATGSTPGGKRRPSASFTDVFISDLIHLKGDFHEMELKEGQKVDVVVGNFRTAAGHPASIQPGSARFTSSDESVVSVEVDPNDETKATAHGLDGSSNESVVVEFRADGDPGAGVREIVATIAIVCTQGDAVVADITAGTPVDENADGSAAAGSTDHPSGGTVDGGAGTGPAPATEPATDPTLPIDGGPTPADAIPATDATPATDPAPATDQTDAIPTSDAPVGSDVGGPV